MSLGLPSSLWWWVNGSNFNTGCITLPLYWLMLPHNVLLVYPIQRDVGWDCAVGNKAAFYVVSVWIMGKKRNPAETVLRYPALKTPCMTWVELMGKITTWTYISRKNQLKWVKIYILRKCFWGALGIFGLAHVPSANRKGLWLVACTAASHQGALETFWLHVWGAVRSVIFVL